MAGRSSAEIDWQRVGKVGEEFGEVIEALINVTGANPRKGQSGGWNDVCNELLDVALCALGAHAHLIGNQSGTMHALSAHARLRCERAGLE